MAEQRISKRLARLLAAGLLASLGMATEYHGTVDAGGLPLPGATVTATRGDSKIVTTTDEKGAFSFRDLADGNWTIAVEMLGFEKLTLEVGVAPEAPPPALDLKFLPEAALTRGPDHGGSVAPATRAANSLPAGPATKSTARPDFQRTSITQSADTSTFSSEGTIKSDEAADLNQSSANSFIVQGSVSSAAGLGAQNDWGPPGGPGMMMPMMMGGRGAPGGDGMPGAGAAMASAGGGGRGGPPGGMMGGPGGGGPPGGMGGRGGPGGFEGPGRGGRGPGGPAWQGRPNARAFGNNRRDLRNSYMASANFSLDNSVWDARTFSVTGADLAKPSYANGRGGFMFGGPLRIPGLISASKGILFTFNLEFQRDRTGTVSNPATVPTAAERAGDFSQISTTLYDPTTGVPFPGNRIPTSELNTTSLAMLNYYPLPNLPGLTRNYQTSLAGSNNSYNINSRVSNIRIGSKDRLNFGLGYQGSNNATPNLFQFVDRGAGRAINTNLAWAHSFSTSLINNVNYTFSRMRQDLSPYFAYSDDVAASLGILGTSRAPMNWGPTSLSFTNYAGLSDGNASLTRNQTSAVGDSVLWVRGEHSLTFGTDYRRQQFNQFADTNGRGAYSFTGSATSLLVDGVAQSGTGYDLADFLLGIPATASIRYGDPDKYLRGSGYDFYVNDDWRLTSRFTLIFGLRWDYASPVTELYNRLVNLSLGPGFSTITPVEAGTNGLSNALINPDWTNFSPRFGFAWRPSTKGSLVVRGGYGIYYNTSVYNLIASNMAQQPPFAQSLSVSGSAADPLNIQSAFLSATNQAAASTFAVDPNYRIGYAQTWNLSIQHDLPLSMFATIGYLGTKGTRLDQELIPNSVAPGAVESIYPHSFIYETSGGNSIYHAAQFQLNRRFTSGIMAHASYQFSKSIDDAGTGGRGQGNTPVAQDWLDLSAERGLSNFDSRHNLSLQIQYSTGMGTPGGTLLNGWKGRLFKDWTVTSSINLHSGNPLTAIVGGNLSQISGTAVTNTLRADATGLPIEAAGMLFNTAAFSAPLPGEWGDAGRNTIPGPTVLTLNGALGRIIRIGERRSVDIQLQSQNALNHVTITNWGTVLGSNTFGLATTAAPMRTITVNVRFRF
jgi:Carboxypeptidase regulatory-like domain